MWDADQITIALKYNASDDLVSSILNVTWRFNLTRLNSKNLFLFILKKSKEIILKFEKLALYCHWVFYFIVSEQLKLTKLP